uniref:Uncharacterized protein n=1 Tax=viral metagenome TaxID=1070528 RepID=A0A6M3KZV9_9ZZZZ
MFKCIWCGKEVKPMWNDVKKRWEPSSLLWKSSPPFYNDIVEAYCSPHHSLAKHEHDRKQK